MSAQFERAVRKQVSQVHINPQRRAVQCWEFFVAWEIISFSRQPDTVKPELLLQNPTAKNSSYLIQDYLTQKLSLSATTWKLKPVLDFLSLFFFLITEDFKESHRRFIKTLKCFYTYLKSPPQHHVAPTSNWRSLYWLLYNLQSCLLSLAFLSQCHLAGHSLKAGVKVWWVTGKNKVHWQTFTLNKKGLELEVGYLKKFFIHWPGHNLHPICTMV